MPLNLGDRLVAGNIVVPCSPCNDRKRKSSPRSTRSINSPPVRPLLVRQADVLSFKFDWVRWREDRRALPVITWDRRATRGAGAWQTRSHRYFVGKGGGGESIGIALVVTRLEELLAKYAGGKGED